MSNTTDTAVIHVIGPQIGPIFEPCGAKITIAFPNNTELKRVTCVLVSEQDEKISITQEPEHEVFRNFVFEFHNLIAGDRYTYSFLDENGEVLDLEGGLAVTDCWFFAPRFDKSHRFLLVSCNNPFHSAMKGEQRFAMLKKLEEFTAENEDIRFLVQGGDQVYNDDIEKNCLAKLKADPADEKGVVQEVIKNYQIYYGNIYYRRLLARLPSVAMLDDHDITDGWGGRPESFDENMDFSREWKRYFEITYDAFKYYQAAKNPEQIFENAATSYLDFANNRLYLLDLRAEKNVKKGILLSAEHLHTLENHLESLPQTVENVFILSPVVPVRISPEKEETLLALADVSYQAKLAAQASLAKSKIEPESWWKKLSKTIVDLFKKQITTNPLAELADDLTDGLTYKVNKPFLVKILQILGGLMKSANKNVFILSGDIHTAGLSEIELHYPDGEGYVIPQIVSSPLGYEPMPKRVKDETTHEFDFVVEKSDGDTPTIMARNIYYRSDRNFAAIKPNALKDIGGVEFIFEGLNRPLSCPAFTGAKKFHSNLALGIDDVV